MEKYEVEYIDVDGIVTPHYVVKILGDGACLFGSLSFILYGTQTRSMDVRHTIVECVVRNWDEYSIASHDRDGNNYSSVVEYAADMSLYHTYGGLCELKAAANLFPFLFEVYYNGKLYGEKYGLTTNPVRRLRFTAINLSAGHFDVYISFGEANHTPLLKIENQTINQIKHKIENLCNISIPKKKRRARYANITRKKQVKAAIQKYTQSKPEPHRAAVATYQQNHPEKHRAAVATYQQNHPEKHRAAVATYQQNHPEKHRAAVATYQQNHPEEHRAAVATYQQNHPEEYRTAVATYQQNHPEEHRAAVATYQQNHPDGHRLSQSRYENNNAGLRREQRLCLWKKKAMSGMSYDQNIAYDNNIGTIYSQKCQFCNAFKWKGETHGMCCNSGKVHLAPLQPPPEPLYSLLMTTHPHHRHFKERIRQYNGCFQMTSFGAKQIVEHGFMPTFKVQGQVYHLHGSLLPQPEEEPKFLQIYFVGDDEKEAVIRSRNYEGVKQELVKQLQKMLHHVNLYIRDLKSTMDKIPSNCESFQVVINADRKPINAHKGRYNAPSVNEVALVIVGQQFEGRDIILQGRDNQLRRINELHRSYDALQYPLMFCYGEDGYSIDIYQRDPKTDLQSKKTVSATNFYAYRLMIREGEENYLLRFGTLLNQYLVDIYAKIETEKLNFLRHHQSELRADKYVHLKDAIGEHDVGADQLGQIVILPSSFTGGPRYMHERAQDAMTYVRNFGSSDLFITFTCNPKWNEIQETLYQGQKHHERHDVIARVFRRKCVEFIDLLVKGQIFGEVRCYMYSVEWQKRGLPHIHILLWLKDAICGNTIDNVVSAEIPDPHQDPVLYEIVKNNMIHGPCGTLNKYSPCMGDGRCTKKYPRPLLKETQIGDDRYPLYRRRSPEDGGFTVNINGIALDNKWVVPYSPVLLRTFQAHINVEISASVKSIKYICKYITKGPDQATFKLDNKEVVDEIQMYESGRYISSSEAVWRIFGFPIHERYPTVTHLDVHLENGQRVYFTAENVADKLINPPNTTLLAFFDLCKTDDFAKTLLYSEVPSYYVWQQNKLFTRRKRGKDVEGWPGIKKDSALGRVYTVHPKNIECYHLRLLLHNVRGPTSFGSLKTVEDVEYPTFKAACEAMGLLENDKQWEFTLEEAALSRSPDKIRQLFTIILVFCQPSNPKNLWEKYKDSLSEDIAYQLNLQDSVITAVDEVYNRCLMLIEQSVLALGGLTLTQYGLPQPVTFEEGVVNNEYLKETSYDVNALAEQVSANLSVLTDEQISVYQQVLNSVQNNIGKTFF